MPLLLASSYPLNPSGSKTLLLGLDGVTFQPVVRIGGSSDGVVLQPEELLRLLQDLKLSITEFTHFQGEALERSEALSESHDIRFAVYRGNPVIILSSTHHSVYLGKVSWDALVRHGFLIRYKLQELQKCSAQASNWARDFVQRLAEREALPSRFPTDRENENIQLYLNHTCFQTRWRSVLQTDYIDKHVNSLQVSFLLEMCTYCFLYVENALLKYRS